MNENIEHLCIPHARVGVKCECCKSTPPHTHGEHGSHTRVFIKETERLVDNKNGTTRVRTKDFLQFICLDDGVIYKELEITREGK